MLTIDNLEDLAISLGVNPVYARRWQEGALEHAPARDQHSAGAAPGGTFVHIGA